MKCQFDWGRTKCQGSLESPHLCTLYHDRRAKFRIFCSNTRQGAPYHDTIVYHVEQLREGNVSTSYHGFQRCRRRAPTVPMHMSQSSRMKQRVLTLTHMRRPTTARHKTVKAMVTARIVLARPWGSTARQGSNSNASAIVSVFVWSVAAMSV